MSGPEMVKGYRETGLESLPTPEELETGLYVVRTNLRTWHISRFLESPSPQNRLLDLFDEANNKLKEIVKVAPRIGKSVQLINGRYETEALFFPKGLYSSSPVERKILDPGSALEIKADYTSFDVREDRPKAEHLYPTSEGLSCFGDYETYVRLDRMGKIFHEEGDLVLKDIENPQRP